MQRMLQQEMISIENCGAQGISIYPYYIPPYIMPSLPESWALLKLVLSVRRLRFRPTRWFAEGVPVTVRLLSGRRATTKLLESVTYCSITKNKCARFVEIAYSKEKERHDKEAAYLCNIHQQLKEKGIFVIASSCQSRFYYNQYYINVRLHR